MKEENWEKEFDIKKMEEIKEEIKKNYEKKDDKMFLGRGKDDTHIY